jgi:quercetin dioxygenase-like cupin family protein
MSTQPHLPPYILRDEEVPSYWQVGILWNVLLSADVTAGQFTLIDQLMPKDAGPPPHRHERYDEGFHLTDGEIEYTIGDDEDQQVLLAKTGDTLWIPRNTTHAFKVTSDTVRALNFYTPGGWDTGLAFLAQPASARTLPPPGGDSTGRQFDSDRGQEYLTRVRELSSQTGF